MNSLPAKVTEICHSSDRSFHSNIDFEEATFLTEVVGSLGKLERGIEVGCAFGVSGACICAAAERNSPEYKHTVIDPFQGLHYNYAGLATIKQSSGLDPNLIEEKSEYALPELVREHEGVFDLAFVDGLHTFDNTFLDIYYCMKLLKLGGHLVVDDCRMPPVARAVSCAQTWPFTKTVARSPNNSTATTRRLSNGLALLLPPKVAEWLPVAIYNRVFPRARMSTMMVLQKTGHDQRHWSWYADF